MALTFSELIEELYNVDEITLMEMIHITSEDLVKAFLDRVEENQEELRELVQDSKEGFDFYEYNDR